MDDSGKGAQGEQKGEGGDRLVKKMRPRAALTVGQGLQRGRQCLSCEIQTQISAANYIGSKS